MKKFIFLTVVFFFYLLLPPSSFGAGAGITSIIHNGDTVITAGEDGFIVIWNTQQETAVERFQLTPYKIKTMVKHPTRDEICIIEMGEMDTYKISAWNYKRKEKLFSINSNNPLTFVNYSAGGSFIITTGPEAQKLSLLDSVTGNIIASLDIPHGITTFGITGRNERNIFLYQSENENFEGQLLYINSNSASTTGRFTAPADITSPLIFGNNRFMAGVTRDGLVLVDAASGNILDNMEAIKTWALLYPADDGFYCLNTENENLFLYRFSVDRNGNLITRQRTPIDFSSDTISAFAYNTTTVFASSNGELFITNQQGRTFPFTYTNQTRVLEIGVSGSSIAVLTENSELFFLPFHYNLLQNNQNITFTQKDGYTRIDALGTNDGRFILWQSGNTRNLSLLISENTQNTPLELNVLTGRSPLRSVSSLNNKILALDASGNVSVRSIVNDLLSQSPDFTFSSLGAIDASFVNEDYFLLCRSVSGANSPFIFVNYNTGETVPVPFSAQAGIMAYTGRNSGITLAAAVERNAAWKTTSVFRVSAAAAAGAPVKILEYPGEDIYLSIAESANSLAVTVGSEGARIIRQDADIFFERTAGLPVKLLGNNDFFIVLDSEGNISWHDNSNGRLLAVFKLNENRWTLTVSGREISGTFLAR